MDRKTLISIIAGCVAVLLLVCILLVGVLDDVWPWDGPAAYGRLITGRTQVGIGPKEETTAPTEETTAPQGGAAGEQENDKPTVGEVGQKPVPPTLPDPDADIKTEIGGVVIDPTGGTVSTPDSNSPTDESADREDNASVVPGW